MLSDYLAGRLLQASVSDVSFVCGSPLFLALLTIPGAKSDTGISIEPKEPSYIGYRRVEVPSSVWGEPEGAAITNVEAIALAKCLGGGDQVIGWALTTSEEEGHVLHLGATVALRIDTVDPEPAIAPGLLRVVFA